MYSCSLIPFFLSSDLAFSVSLYYERLRHNACRLRFSYVMRSSFVSWFVTQDPWWAIYWPGGQVWQWQQGRWVLWIRIRPLKSVRLQIRFLNLVNMTEKKRQFNMPKRSNPVRAQNVPDSTRSGSAILATFVNLLSFNISHSQQIMTDVLCV